MGAARKQISINRVIHSAASSLTNHTASSSTVTSSNNTVESSTIARPSRSRQSILPAFSNSRESISTGHKSILTDIKEDGACDTAATSTNVIKQFKPLFLGNNSNTATTATSGYTSTSSAMQPLQDGISNTHTVRSHSVSRVQSSRQSILPSASSLAYGNNTALDSIEETPSAGLQSKPFRLQTNKRSYLSSDNSVLVPSCYNAAKRTKNVQSSTVKHHSTTHTSTNCWR